MSTSEKQFLQKGWDYSKRQADQSQKSRTKKHSLDWTLIRRVGPVVVWYYRRQGVKGKTCSEVVQYCPLLVGPTTTVLLSTRLKKPRPNPHLETAQVVQNIYCVGTVRLICNQPTPLPPKRRSAMCRGVMDIKSCHFDGYAGNYPLFPHPPRG